MSYELLHVPVVSECLAQQHQHLVGFGVAWILHDIVWLDARSHFAEHVLIYRQIAAQRIVFINALREVVVDNFDSLLIREHARILFESTDSINVIQWQWVQPLIQVRLISLQNGNVLVDILFDLIFSKGTLLLLFANLFHFNFYFVVLVIQLCEI